MNENCAKTISCEEARQRLVSRSLGDEPSSQSIRETDEHVAACEPCQAFRALMANTDETITGAVRGRRSLEAIDDAARGLAPSDEVVSRIVQSIHGRSEAPPAGAHPRAPFWLGSRVLWSAAAACLIALCALQAALLWQGRPGSGEPRGPVDLQPLKELVEARTEAARRELALLRTELAQTREQLDGALREVAVHARETKTILLQELSQERAMRVVRAAYLPQDQGVVRPDELSALMNVVQGATLFSSGHYEASIRLFRRSANAFTNQRFKLLSLFALGTSQKCAGLYEASLETYDHILAITEPRAATSSAPARGGRGREASHDPPRLPDPNGAYRAMAYHFKGWSLYCLGEREANLKNPAQAQARLDEAKRCYEKALDIEPTYAKVRLNLWKLHSLRARVFVQLGQPAQQMASLREASQQLVQAEKDLLQRLERRPEDAKAHFTLAMLYVCQNRDKAGLAHLEEAVQINPSLASLLRSEHAFNRLASTKQYQKMLRQADEFPEQVTVESLFTDTDFPTDIPRRAEPPGSHTPSRVPR